MGSGTRDNFLKPLPARQSCTPHFPKCPSSKFSPWIRRTKEGEFLGSRRRQEERTGSDGAPVIRVKLLFMQIKEIHLKNISTYPTADYSGFSTHLAFSGHTAGFSDWKTAAMCKEKMKLTRLLEAIKDICANSSAFKSAALLGIDL